MIAPDIRVSWTVHSVIKSDAHLARMAMPVVQLAAFLAAAARDRVRATGQGPRATMPSYSTRWGRIKRWQGKPWKSQRFDDSGQMWAGLRVKLNSPIRARGSFVKSRKPMTIETPIVVDGEIMKDKSGKDIVWKRKTGGSFKLNSKLAAFLAQRNRIDLLAPTRLELAALDKLADSLFTDVLRDALNIEHVTFTGAQKRRSLERRAKKAMRDLNAARGVR